MLLFRKGYGDKSHEMFLGGIPHPWVNQAGASRRIDQPTARGRNDPCLSTILSSTVIHGARAVALIRAIDYADQRKMVCTRTINTFRTQTSSLGWNLPKAIDFS